VQVNKLFHNIALSRHLWISVVRGLYLRRLIDAVPDEVLETLTRDALVEEVKRAVLGPRTWSQRRGPPAIYREITIPMDARRRQCELLPGGRYLLCYVARDDTARDVECWEVYTKQRVWVWSRPGCSLVRAGFHFPDREHEAIVYILYCESIVVMSVLSTHFLDPFIILSSRGADEALFLKVNLETGHSEELFDLPHGRCHRPQICGDLFACRLSDRWPILDVLLINWRATEYVILSFPDPSV
jgi:hypothetical protein